MKKIYSFMVAAVALFAAVSCNKELPQEENLPTLGETVVYTASTDAADTKAALNEATKKSEWVADDAITVHDGEKGWTFTTAEAGANVDFSNSEGFGDYRPVMAVYPAAEVFEELELKTDYEYTANVEAKTAKAYIPTWQQAQAGTYHSPAALAVAYSEGNTFAFKNAHALLKFTVNTDNVTHVIFHGNGSEAITGDVYVTLGEDGVESVECLETVFTSEKWNDETQQNEQVSETKYGTWVECYAYHDDANKYFAKDQTYYIAVAPQKFEGGVTVRVKIDGGEELVAKTTTKPVETKINTILNLGEIKYEAPVVHEWAVAGTFNGWSTTANPMELVDGYYVAKNITGLNYTAPTGEETGSSTGIKFVNNGDTWRAGEGQVTAGTWAYVWGDGGNIYVDGATAETAYDIYLNPSEGDYGKFVIVAAGAEMPEDTPSVVSPVWAVAGTFNGWDATANPMIQEGDYYVAKNITGLNYSDPNVGETGSSTGIKFVNNGTDWRGGEGQVTAGTWVYVWGDGGNIYVDGATAETAYDIYLNPSEGDYGKFVIVAAGAAMPEDKPEVVEKEWGIVGTMTNWNDNIPMTLVNGWYVAENVTIKTSDEFKFRVGTTWDELKTYNLTTIVANTEYTTVDGQGDGNGMKVAVSAIYSVYLSADAATMKVVKTGDIPLPEVKNWGIVGSITSWGAVTDITMALEGDWYIAPAVEMPAGTEFKFRVDNKWASEGGEELTYAGSVVSGTEYNVSGGASNITITSGAVYDVYLSHDETKMKVVKVADLPEPDIMAKDGYVYLLPNSNWTQASARFAIYFFGKGEEWVSMTKVEGTNYYGVKISDIISKGYTGMIFCRMNPDAAANNWDNKWNQTGDLSVSTFTSGKNCFSLPSGSWNDATKSWSTVVKLN